MGKILQYDPLERRHKPGPLHELATALGYLTMDWAGLDASLDALTEACLGVSEAQQSCLTAVIPGIEQRCQLVVRLAYINPPTDEWQSDVLEIAGLLQGDMATRRNRYIHDAWGANGDHFHKLDKRAVVKKGKPREPARLYGKRLITVKLDEIWSLIEQISNVSSDLFWLSLEAQVWRHTQQPPEPRSRLSLPHTHNRPKKGLATGATRWNPSPMLPILDES